MSVAIPAIPLNYNQSGDSFAYVNNETRAYVAAMTVKPDAARKTILDTFFTDLKAAVALSKFDAFYLLSGHADQATRINLVSPANVAAIVGAPLFAVDGGWLRDASNDGMLNTGYIADTPGNQWDLNSAHLGAWSLTEFNTTNNGTMGFTTPAFLSTDNASAAMQARINDGTTATVSNSGGVGHFVANRSASNARQFYKNGVSIGSDAVVSTATPTTGQIMGLLQRNAASLGTAQSHHMAAAHWGASLTAPEVAGVHAAIATYLAAT